MYFQYLDEVVLWITDPFMSVLFQKKKKKSFYKTIANFPPKASRMRKEALLRQVWDVCCLEPVV